MTWTWELHTIVAEDLRRMKALRTIVQFKGVSEKATIQAEEVDINILHVILGQARRYEILAKLKTLFYISDSHSHRVWWSIIKAACT